MATARKKVVLMIKLPIFKKGIIFWEQLLRMSLSKTNSVTNYFTGQFNWGTLEKGGPSRAPIPVFEP